MTQQGSAPLNRPYQMQERLTLPSKSMMSDWMDENTKRKKQAYGPKSFVANGPHHAYQLDLMFTQHLEDQQYDTAMVCIDAFSTYAAVAIIQGKTESDLAKPSQTVYTDGETGIRNSGLFQNYCQ